MSVVFGQFAEYRLPPNSGGIAGIPQPPLGAGFGTGLAKLVEALNTDFEWLREHTRYLHRATE